MSKRTIGNLICIALCVVTLTLFCFAICCNDKLFGRANKVNINDGVAVFEEDEIRLEPGKSVSRVFFIENESRRKVYYRLYFENVTGQLAELAIVSLYSGDKLLYQGRALDLKESNAESVDEKLLSQERRYLRIEVSLDENVDNKASSQFVKFDIRIETARTIFNRKRSFN